MGEIRDVEFYTLYDNEGNPLETTAVEVPTDAELRDCWIIADESGAVLGGQETRLGRVKPEEVLGNHLGQEEVCCYQVSREEYQAMLDRLRAAAEEVDYVPPVDEKFGERFIRAEVRVGRVRVRVSEHEWR
ncbi:MAG: hypothetical protein KJ002_12810 [Candidatus Dadabacteria bacterium]|nr:hypothetical protein [Candidatus Dadabacteria bacterium]